MGTRGQKSKGKVHIEWSAEFAYAIGLIVTDGCLYRDKPVINLTSKDYEQMQNFARCLGISINIGMKGRGGSTKKEYYYVQIYDQDFYNFLFGIGITPAKSKIIGAIDIPNEYFFDYIRGCFDGDGCFYSYWDPRWRSSHMFYIGFTSASQKHIIWVRNYICRLIHIQGHITTSKKKDRENQVFNLKFGKKESLVIIKKMYYSPTVVCLSRKREKIEKALQVEKKQ